MQTETVIIPAEYVPTWAAPNNPTAGLTETAARAYWKARSVLYDCRFALRPSATLPADLRAAWAALEARVSAAGKETPSDRAHVAKLRDARRAQLAGDGYTLPADLPAAKPSRAARCCPHCGKGLSLAA